MTSGRNYTPREIDDVYEPEIAELRERKKALTKELNSVKRRLHILTDVVACFGEKGAKKVA